MFPETTNLFLGLTKVGHKLQDDKVTTITLQAEQREEVYEEQIRTLTNSLQNVRTNILLQTSASALLV